MRFVLASLLLGGCFSNPTVEVDFPALYVAQGTSSDVLVSIDGAGVDDVSGLLWAVEDPDLATVTIAHDGQHLRVGGNLEGTTAVHVYAYGQDIRIPTRIGPPAILEMWTEPEAIKAELGSLVEVHAKGFDSLARVIDLTVDSHWAVRDESVADFEHDGMMLRAMGEGQTTLHVNHGTLSRVVPVSVFK